jgi:hypothetical protein
MSTTITTSSIELQERTWQQPPQLAQSSTEPVSSRLSRDEAHEDTRDFHQSLEPADRGAAAWRLLGAAFVFEALLWGKTFHNAIK